MVKKILASLEVLSDPRVDIDESEVLRKLARLSASRSHTPILSLYDDIGKMRKTRARLDSLMYEFIQISDTGFSRRSFAGRQIRDSHTELLSAISSIGYYPIQSILMDELKSGRLKPEYEARKKSGQIKECLSKCVTPEREFDKLQLLGASSKVLQSAIAEGSMSNLASETLRSPELISSQSELGETLRAANEELFLIGCKSADIESIHSVAADMNSELPRLTSFGPEVVEMSAENEGRLILEYSGPASDATNHVFIARGIDIYRTGSEKEFAELASGCIKGATFSLPLEYPPLSKLGEIPDDHNSEGHTEFSRMFWDSTQKTTGSEGAEFSGVDEKWLSHLYRTVSQADSANSAKFAELELDFSRGLGYPAEAALLDADRTSVLVINEDGKQYSNYGLVMRDEKGQDGSGNAIDAYFGDFYGSSNWSELKSEFKEYIYLSTIRAMRRQMDAIVLRTESELIGS